jgi:MFS family permease
MAGIPLFFGGLGCLVTGALTPRLVRAMGRVATTRRMLAMVGFTGAAALLVYSMYIQDPLFAMIAMGCASFCNDVTMPGSWSTCMDIGGKYAGTVSGSMNMMGAFGGMLAPTVVGLILDSTGRNWTITFWISGAVYFLGGLCWWFIDPVTPLQTEEKAA